MVLGQVEGVLWLVFFDHKEQRVTHASLFKKQKKVFIMCLILQKHECGQGVNSKVLANTSFSPFLVSVSCYKCNLSTPMAGKTLKDHFYINL